MENTKNIPKMTETMVKLYTELATLEKEGKHSLAEYKSLLSLVPRSIELEKQEYQDTHCISQDKEQLEMYYKTRKSLEEAYQLPSVDMLAKMRFYNRSMQEYSCTLNDMVTGDVQKNIQGQLEENLMIEICKYLKHGKLSKEERKCLIDYKYGMIMTSQILEDKLLSEELPFLHTSDDMTQEELRDSQELVLSHVRSLYNYFGSIQDDHITEQTILYILYLKACLPMLGPTLRICKVNNINEQIQVKKLYGKVMQVGVTRMCNMLSYAIEEPSYQKKMK